MSGTALRPNERRVALLRAAQQAAHRARLPRTEELGTAIWTARAVMSTSRQLRNTPLEGVQVTTPPPAGLESTRAVELVLRASRTPCLTASLVRQRWFGHHGIEQDVVIGVTSPRDGFRAHAWLEFPGELSSSEYTAITRLPASRADRSGRRS